MQTEPVADWELEKVRLKYRHDHAEQLSSTLSRAIQLAYYTVAWNDPNVINTEESQTGRGYKRGFAARGKSVSDSHESKRNNHDS